MVPNIENVIRRTRRYWYEDGIAEVATGLLFLAAGAIFALGANISIEPGSLLAAFLTLPFIMAVSMIGTAVLLGIGKGIIAIKNRLTFPRTGYVAYKKPEVKQRPTGTRLLLFVGLMLVAGVLGAVFAAVLARLQLPDWMMKMSMTEGIFLAGGLIALGAQLHLVRFHILAALSLLVGAAIALGLNEASTEPGARDSALYFALMGAALVISGGLTLAYFLRHNRAPAESQP